MGKQASSHRFISACNIITNAGRRDLSVVDNYPADRLTVALMMIGHEQSLHDIAGFCACFCLGKRSAVWVTPDPHAVYILISHTTIQLLHI